MVVVDANFLPYLFHRGVKHPTNPDTGETIADINDRIDLLIDELEEGSETIIVPTPVLTEFLVFLKDDGPLYLNKINKSPLYKIEPFDEMAAIELAAIRLKIAATLSRRQTKRQSPGETWAKIGFDRQIVAIAKAHKVHTIYSDDRGLRNFAIRNHLKVVRTWELCGPEPEAQMTLHEVIQRAEQTARAAVEGSPSESGSKK